MLVTEETLHHRNHETEIKWVSNTNHWHLYLSICQTDHRKEHVLDYSWTSSIHLLHKFPYPFIDDKIILFFFDIRTKLIFGIKKPRIIDTSQFLYIYILQEGSIQFRPLFFYKIYNLRFSQILLDKLRFHSFSKLSKYLPFW